ncbi:MAG: hypothetical protein ACI8UO_002238 [Verrucomicrobiales bacterium]|jgi:uncharacterized protein (DUF58 family)
MPADQLKPEDVANVRSLTLLAEQVVEGFQSGLHRSPHKGFSVEFKQHRQYVPGDELRFVDWKVFGKSDKFFIREYEEETNLRCTVLLDQSGSMAYKGRQSAVSKFEFGKHLTVCLGYLMLQQQDAVGVITFDDQVREQIPPRSRPAHLSSIVEVLNRIKPGADTDVAEAFKSAVPKIHKRGLVVILTDCFGDLAELMRSLAHLRFRKHEIVIFQILDRDEIEFPFTERSRFESLEPGLEPMTVDPIHLREAYLEELRQFREELRERCFNNRVDLVPVVTDRPYAEALAEYLAIRRAR